MHKINDYIDSEKFLTKEAFNYFLPDDLIAQSPIEPRDSSRLLVLDKKNGEIKHCRFYNIIDYLNKGDLLILNDSKVFPARIYGKKSDSGATVEFLLLSRLKKNVWTSLSKPGKKAKQGCKFIFGDGILEATVEDVTTTGERIIKFEDVPDFYERLNKIGQAPLPPYIKKKLDDPSRYQTVYASNLGSSAAPTAGLHFTDNLLENIKKKGIKIAFVTLHVGLGTFRPVKEDNIVNHKMHNEFFSIPEETASMIEQTKLEGGRIISVGTTSCRTLEAAASLHGKIIPCSGKTDIFIYPGYKFKVIDALVTNFHLPESTLIMLVSAFAGYKNIMNAYQIAVQLKYRFFSFGDAMLII